MKKRKKRRCCRAARRLALAALAFAAQITHARAEDHAETLRGALLEDRAPPLPLRRERKPTGGAAQIETGTVKPAAIKRVVADTAAPAQDETASLRGTLAEDKSSTAVSVGFAAGYTTNAGPSLEKEGSGGTRTTAEMLHVFERDGHQVSLKGAFADRRYIDRPDVSELQYAVSGMYGGTLKTGAQVSASLKTERRVDVDENVHETAMSVGYEWPKAVLTPFVQVLGAYLDYGAIAGDFLEFGNQDDRDRFSGTVQAGLKYELAEKLTLRSVRTSSDTWRHTMISD